jgi:hypothetical protein
VRAVALAHGGDVTVRSVVGQGSEFELTLPVPGQSALPAAQADGADGSSVAAPAVAAPTTEDQGSSRR